MIQIKKLLNLWIYKNNNFFNYLAAFDHYSSIHDIYVHCQDELKASLEVPFWTLGFLLLGYFQTVSDVTLSWFLVLTHSDSESYLLYDVRYVQFD